MAAPMNACSKYCRRSARRIVPKRGFARPWPARSGSWVSAIGYTKMATRGRNTSSRCAQLAKDTGHTPMETMADTIEQIVVAEKHLPPNLDWPSARLYHYLDLPVELYTPLFVVSRVVGWSAYHRAA